MPREISAGIIIYKREKDRDGKVDTKYLLLYHGRGYWNFPKGKLEAGERGYDAALREVTEETGISPRLLRVVRDFKMTDKYIYQWEGQKIFKIVIFFLAQATKPEIKLSYEHEGYGWFLHNDAQKLLKHRNSKSILKNAHDYLRRKSVPRSPQNPARPNA
ncbi:MAG: NUDIX domain-containing protein [Candidatus Harrisonbacteria bacterium]|nr:NUDIX domain-containing protein [Candidatus Harrisonbacteria bacterium]